MEGIKFKEESVILGVLHKLQLNIWSVFERNYIENVHTVEKISQWDLLRVGMLGRSCLLLQWVRIMVMGLISID